jgi:hypothetical protein
MLCRAFQVWTLIDLFVQLSQMLDLNQLAARRLLTPPASVRRTDQVTTPLRKISHPLLIPTLYTIPHIPCNALFHKYVRCVDE